MTEQAVHRPTIVVGYDGGPGALDALALGATFKHAVRARMVVVSAVVDPLGPAGSALLPALHRDADETLQRARVHIDDISEVTFRTETGHSAAAVLQRVAAHAGAQLIVVGATHHRPGAELMFPSVTHQVLQASPCAVAVAPRGFADSPHRGICEIGVGFDDTPEARAAVAEAASLARETGARLHVLHAYHPVLETLPLAMVSYAEHDYAIRAREHGAELLSAATALAGEALVVKAELLAGDAAESLVEATRSLDVLYLGSRGYGPVRRLLVGSVSGRIVRHAHCPVVILPRPALADDHAEAPAATHGVGAR